MKLAALYRGDAGLPSLHVAVADGFAAVDEIAAAGGAPDLAGLHDVGELFARGPAAVGQLRELAPGAAASVDPAGARYAPPVLRPSKIICVGLNYAEGRYDLDRGMFPHRVLVGSETFTSKIGRLWPMVVANPNVICDFTWTCCDYLGEVVIGATSY